MPWRRDAGAPRDLSLLKEWYISMREGGNFFLFWSSKVKHLWKEFARLTSVSGARSVTKSWIIRSWAAVVSNESRSWTVPKAGESPFRISHQRFRPIWRLASRSSCHVTSSMSLTTSIHFEMGLAASFVFFEGGSSKTSSTSKGSSKLKGLSNDGVSNTGLLSKKPFQKPVSQGNEKVLTGSNECHASKTRLGTEAELPTLALSKSTFWLAARDSNCSSSSEISISASVNGPYTCNAYVQVATECRHLDTQYTSQCKPQDLLALPDQSNPVEGNQEEQVCPWQSTENGDQVLALMLAGKKPTHAQTNEEAAIYPWTPRLSTKNYDLQKNWKVPPTHHFEMLKTDINEFRGKCNFNKTCWIGHLQYTSQVCTSEWTTDVSSFQTKNLWKKEKGFFADAKSFYARNFWLPSKIFSMLLGNKAFIFFKEEQHKSHCTIAR